jgi:alkylation response protein AidB-like acyl-CoA dehydrogenase
MQLSLTASEITLREEVRTFLDARAPHADDIPAALDERTEFLRGWQRQLRDAGLVALSWPPEFGGRGATMGEQMVVDMEMARWGAPELVGAVGLSVIGPSLIQYGSPGQKLRYLGPLLSGEELWCQGFSETDAGSDLASLRTRATDAGDHFVLSGHKIWTTMAQFARWCVVLARTQFDGPAHRGISYLIVDLQSPGIEVRPIILSTGEGEFGEVYFDNVLVPKENLLGPLHGGWAIAMHTLAHERGPYAMARQVVLRVALDRAIAEAHQIHRGGRPAIEDRHALDGLVGAHVMVEVLKHQCYRSVGRIIQGGEHGFEASIDKVALALAEQRVSDAALDVLGAHAPRGAGTDDWHRFYLYGRAASVYGGSAQIQKNIISQRILGLPRSA